MNLNWSNRVIKYVLFVFNLLFVISGIIMIAVGVSVKAYYNDYDFFLNSSYFDLPNLLIAIGSLIFFISFFGCCGAIKESWFMIFIFSILLGLIFIMEFSAGIAGYVLRDQTVSYLTDELEATMQNYHTIASGLPLNSDTKMWDLIQEEFKCCGTNGPNDWPAVFNKVTPSSSSLESTPPTKVTTTTLPTVVTTTTKPATTTTTKPTTTTTPTETTTPPTSPTEDGNGQNIARRIQRDILPQADPVINYDLPGSCCESQPGATGNLFCNSKDTNTTTHFTTGCVESFGDFLKSHAVTLGGVGIAIAFIQLFGVIFACHLARQIRHGFYST